MPDLIEFLRERIAEDEAAARAARRHSDRDWDASQTQGRNFVAADHADVLLETMDDGMPGLVIAEHIARWDPARVLAEVTAKRAILDLYEHWNAYVPVTTGSRQTGKMQAMIDAASRCALGNVVEALAQPYARHPGFDPSWTTA